MSSCATLISFFLRRKSVIAAIVKQKHFHFFYIFYITQTDSKTDRHHATVHAMRLNNYTNNNNYYHIIAIINNVSKRTVMLLCTYFRFRQRHNSARLVYSILCAKALFTLQPCSVVYTFINMTRTLTNITVVKVISTNLTTGRIACARKTPIAAGKRNSHLAEMCRQSFDTSPSCCVKKVKASHTRLPSVGPGADPGVQAVSQQVTISHPPDDRLSLLSARLAVTFPAAEHHRFLAGTKLYCLVTRHTGVNNLPKVVTQLCPE